MQMISGQGFGEQINQNPKNKKMLNIVLICIVVVLVITAILIGLIYWISVQQQKALKVYVNDQKVSFNDDTFIIDNNGKVYVAIKDIASTLGYDAHNGEYKVYSEEQDKCYVENSNETASFFLNSNIIKKVATNSSDDYENFTISDNVQVYNNKLYVTSEGIQIGYNVKFGYDASKNTIKIYTLPHLVTLYTKTITDYGYKGISEDFSNQKAILYNMFVVKNASDKYGVIDIKNNEIIGCKYDNMKFNESLQEFFVTNSQKKVGIILSDGKNKINIEYDDIKVLSKEKGLYIVKNNNKYGIIDKDGKIKINVAYDDLKTIDSKLGLYMVKHNNKYGVVNENDKQIVYCEYDSIGLEIRSYENQNIENTYLLFNNAIPVKKNNKWGLFDISGNEILECIYDSFGCVSSTVVKDKIVNNVLIVPDCECLVVCKDKKYGIVNKKGEFVVQCLLNAVYSMTNSGVDKYYMTFDNGGLELEYEVLWYLEQMGLYIPKNNAEIDVEPEEDKTIIEETNTTDNNTTNTVDNNIENNNTTNTVSNQVSSSTNTTSTNTNTVSNNTTSNELNNSSNVVMNETQQNQVLVNGELVEENIIL